MVCGDCYGAATDKHPCCITCEEVIIAYEEKEWQFSTSKFAQCVNESKESPLGKYHSNWRMYYNRVFRRCTIVYQNNNLFMFLLDCEAKLQEDCGLTDMLNFRNNFNPVCGSDDKTYDNICKLEKTKCRSNPDLVVQYEMACHGNDISMLLKYSE